MSKQGNIGTARGSDPHLANGGFDFLCIQGLFLALVGINRFYIVKGLIIPLFCCQHSGAHIW